MLQDEFKKLIKNTTGIKPRRRILGALLQLTCSTCSIVGETNCQAISGQLMGIGSSHHNITSDGSVHDLGSDILVGLD
jgi:hypothetical protein